MSPRTRVEVRRIRADETLPLRAALLRPGQPPEKLRFPGDDDTLTRHFGAFANGELCGIASVYRQPLPGVFEAAAWQLRGMATVEALRGQGAGRALVQACVATAEAAGGEVLWCNARIGAIGFYRKLGFHQHGGEFEVLDVGPHVVMWRLVRNGVAPLTG